MATKPSRLQQQACDVLAGALVQIAEAVRLDGKGRFDATDLGEVAGRLARASSAFSPDQIVARALEKRGRALGLPESTAELMTLMEAEIKPLQMLLLPDDAFRDLARTMDEGLGEV
jgi:hypothetical protein